MLDLELGKVETIRPPDQSVESEPFPTTLRVRAYTDACSHFRRKVGLRNPARSDGELLFLFFETI